MSFIISKVLSFLINPLTWVFIILCFSIYHNKNKTIKRYLIGGTLLLFFFSNTFIFHLINDAWEIKPIDDSLLTEKYEVAIILGGVASLDRKHDRIEFHPNSGRIFNVLPLYFNGQVDKLLLSGGSGRLIPEEKEADVLAEYLLTIGVKKEDLLLENKSRNTYENALYSKELMDENNITGNVLLSTSAIHMKRSYACFKKQGVVCTPFSANQMSFNRDYYFDTLFIPNPIILQYWYQLIHEWIGILSYKLMGRI